MGLGGEVDGPVVIEIAPPDGGYGYFVALAASMIQFVCIGSINAFGVFFPPILDEFPWMGATGLAAVVSVGNFITPMVGIWAGNFVDRHNHGFRLTTLLAAVSVSIAFLSSSFVPSGIWLFLTYGIFAGVAAGCSISPSAAAVGQWFEEKRSMAIGIAYAGTGLGGVALPVVGTYVLQRTEGDWRLAFRFFSVLGVLLIGCALVMKRRVITRGGENMPTESILAGMKELIRVDGFPGLLAVGFFYSWGYFVPLIHIVVYSLSIGLSTTNAALQLSALGLFATIGNITCGVLADRLGLLQVFSICHGMSGLALCLLPFCRTASTVAAFAICAGFFNGGCVTCYPSLAATYFPPERMAAGIALIYTGFGVGSLLGPIISGMIIDHTGEFSLAFLLGGLAFFGALAVALTTLPTPPPRLPLNDDFFQEEDIHAELLAHYRADQDGMLHRCSGATSGQGSIPKARSYGTIRDL